MNVAKSVRLKKEARPQDYCADKKCLWSVARSGPCPRHPGKPLSPNAGGSVTKRIAARIVEMSIDPVYRPAMVSYTMMSAVTSRRSDFVTEVAYLRCQLYVLETLLPRYVNQTTEPFNVDACLGLARMAVAAFAAADRLRALT